MASESDNPYAPPTSVDAEPNIGGVWRVDGDCLVVREGAALPPVDLDGRGAGGPLTPILLRLRVPVDAKSFGVFIGMAVVTGGYVIVSRQAGNFSMLGLLVALVVGQFLFRGVKVRTAPATVRGWISLPALRATTRRVKWRRGLKVGASVLMIGAVGFVAAGMGQLYGSSRSRPDWLIFLGKAAIGMGGGGMLLLVVSGVWEALDQGWRCTRLRDGWVWIRGIGPEALAGLSARATAPLPEEVMRKTYKMRLDRMPLGFWRVVFGGGLTGWLRAVWVKASMRGPRELVCFHWSETEILDRSHADEELSEEWRKQVDGSPLAEWQAVFASRSESAGGTDEVHQINYLSPDGLHAAATVRVRSAIGRELQELREVNIRSFRRDGTTVITGSLRPFLPLADHIDFALATGSPVQMEAIHRSRLREEDLVAVDAAELKRRDEEESEARHAAAQAAGFFGPVEEVPFPGKWEWPG